MREESKYRMVRVTRPVKALFDLHKELYEKMRSKKLSDSEFLDKLLERWAMTGGA